MNLRQRRPPDYSNDELVDPEAESQMDQSEVDGSADRGHDKMHRSTLVIYRHFVINRFDIIMFLS